MEDIIYAQTTEETLSETLQQEEPVDTDMSFGTILVATLTPTLFILIGYLLMKFFSEENK